MQQFMLCFNTKWHRIYLTAFSFEYAANILNRYVLSDDVDDDGNGDMSVLQLLQPTNPGFPAILTKTSIQLFTSIHEDFYNVSYLFFALL